MLKVSILMACYNSSKFLERSIGSVLSQTYHNWQLVCVDDGSTDDTFDILTRYSIKDDRINVFKKTNSGHAAPNFNYALNYANGDFIFLLGHDDELSNDILDKMVERQLETNADVIIPDCFFYYPNDTKKNWLMSGIVNNFHHNQKSVFKKQSLSNIEATKLSLRWQIHAFCLYSSKIVKNIKFCEKGMNGDEYSARLFLFSANKIEFSDGKYIYYQIENSITKKLSPKKFNTLIPLYLLEQFLIKNKFSSKNIKLINNTRFNLHSELLTLYHENKSKFSIAEQLEIDRYLNEHSLLFSRYYSLLDKIFRKEKTKNAKFIVLFHKFKFRYKKIS